MASSLLVPLQQILASNGDLGVGLQLFVYQTGTTTKLNTYPTAANADAGTSANSNPLVLNARGEVPALFVPDSVTDAKVVLAPAADTDPPASPITTRDGILVTAKVIKNNYTATTAPTTGDDSDDGYAVGSRWIDVTNDLAYVCVDASVGAAVWLRIASDTSGTWTAVVQGSGTAGTYEIASQISTYYRIGKMYFVSSIITLAGSITGSGTGDLNITGLPATKKANMAARGTAELSKVDFNNNTAWCTAAFASDTSASAVIQFNEILDDAQPQQVAIADVAAGDVIGFSIAYEVA